MLSQTDKLTIIDIFLLTNILEEEDASSPGDMSTIIFLQYIKAEKDNSGCNNDIRIE